MGEVRRSIKLPCTTCGGFLFTAVVEVSHHPNGGISDIPAGKVCSSCGTILNTRASWAKLEIDAQREKLKQMLEAGELELEGLLADSMKSAEEAGVGTEALTELMKKGRQPRSREETELGKSLDSADEKPST